MANDLQSKKLNLPRGKHLLLLGGLVLLAAIVFGVAALVTAPAEVVDYHAEAGESMPLRVDFKPLSTAGEDYDRLYEACSEHINSNRGRAASSGGGNTVVEVNEATYIDGGSAENVSVEAVTVEYQEYDRVYFEDLLLLRYVNEYGEIQVIGAMLDERNPSKIQVLAQQELQHDHFSFTDWEAWNLAVQEEEDTDSVIVPEEAYITCIGTCVAQMLTRETDGQLIASHFTAEGETAVRRIVQVLGIDPDCAVVMQLGAAGKSDLGSDIMDRLYLRLEITVDGETSYMNLLLKLNRDTMIFDVDMI